MTSPALPATDDVPEQIAVRRAKRERLFAAGVAPYPVGVPRTATIQAVRAAHPDLAPGQETDDQVGLAGRVVFLRNTGKLCFVTLQDGEGTRLQAMLSRAEVGEEALASFKSDVDLGDHLFVHGRVIASRRGELSVFADSYRIAAKALRPLPKTYETEDGEQVALSEEGRVRRRHLDLIMRPAARARNTPVMVDSPWMVSTAPPRARPTGEKTAAHAVIQYAGGVNCLSGFQGYRPMNAEALASAAPDIVLTSTQSLEAHGGADKFWERPELALTPAYRRRALVTLDALLLLGFGPRMPPAVRETHEKFLAWMA